MADSTKQGRGRPREEGSARSARRTRAQELADQQQDPRRQRIVRLLDRYMESAGRFSDPEREKTFKAGVYHALRHLVPVNPALAALLAIQDGPGEDDIKADAFPPDYQEIKIYQDAYAIYCAVFDLLHGLESLAGPVSPQGALDYYEIKRR